MHALKPWGFSWGPLSDSTQAAVMLLIQKLCGQALRCLLI